MKKILLIIAIVLCIFQMVVLATAIDVGSECEDRAATTANDERNYVDKNNPANESGTITTIEIWCNIELENVEIGIFYVVEGNFLTTRSDVTLGTVTVGEHSVSNTNPITLDSGSSPISLAIETGDYIGIHYTAGAVERDASGAGYWYTSSTDAIPCINQEFSTAADRTISLKGIGTTGEGNAIMFGMNF